MPSQFDLVSHFILSVILSEKPRLIWNGTSKRSAHKVAMNDITPTDNKAQITFGYVFMAFIVWIYNLRISFSNEESLLAFMDITACFRWPHINPDLVGTFGFLIGTYYFAANAMAFGVWQVHQVGSLFGE